MILNYSFVSFLFSLKNIGKKEVSDIGHASGYQEIKRQVVAGQVLHHFDTLNFFFFLLQQKKKEIPFFFFRWEKQISSEIRNPVEPSGGKEPVEVYTVLCVCVCVWNGFVVFFFFFSWFLKFGFKIERFLLFFKIIKWIF